MQCACVSVSVPVYIGRSLDIGVLHQVKLHYQHMMTIMCVCVCVREREREREIEYNIYVINQIISHLYCFMFILQCLMQSYYYNIHNLPWVIILTHLLLFNTHSFLSVIKMIFTDKLLWHYYSWSCPTDPVYVYIFSCDYEILFKWMVRNKLQILFEMTWDFTLSLVYLWTCKRSHKSKEDINRNMNRWLFVIQLHLYNI